MIASEVYPTKIAGQFSNLWYREYVKSKLRIDPLYNAVFETLEDSPLPLLDIGCGLGLLAFYLRQRGFNRAIYGFDFDANKIRAAQKVGTESYDDTLKFQHGDAKDALPNFSGNVSILDVLQYLTKEEQTRLLTQTASGIAPGGSLVIRGCLETPTLRFHFNKFCDFFAKWSFWMKAAPVHYPSERSLRDTLEPLGLVGAVSPLWGRTPFNNHLVVFRRPT